MREWLQKIPRWVWLVLALLLAVVGGFIFHFGNVAGNPILIAIGVIPIATAFFLVKHWYDS